MGGGDSTPKEMSLNLTREDYKFVKKKDIPNIGSVKIMENIKTNALYLVKTM